MQDFPKFYLLKYDLPVFVRRFKPSDIDQIRVGFQKMSDRSRYRRFFQTVRELPDSNMQALLAVDNYNTLAICAGVIQPDGWEGAGIARFTRIEPDSKIADVALTVIDKYQGLGLGSLLFQLLIHEAITCDLTHFSGHVLPDNTHMLKILRHHSAQSQLIDGPVLNFKIPLRSEKLPIKEISYKYQNFKETITLI